MKFITMLVLILSIFINNAFSQNEEDIIKYRKNIMKAVGNHISIIASNLTGTTILPTTGVSGIYSITGTFSATQQ